MVACVLTTLAGELIAWHLLLPRLQQRVADDVLAVPNAIQSAAATTGGLMLAGLGAALLACTLYNRLVRERARRREGAARGIAFLTSLGHAARGQPPSFDRQSQD